MTVPQRLVPDPDNSFPSVGAGAHTQAVVPGRNDPCHCGSGKKYKNCHLDIDRDAQRAYGEAFPML